MPHTSKMSKRPIYDFIVLFFLLATYHLPHTHFFGGCPLGQLLLLIRSSGPCVDVAVEPWRAEADSALMDPVMHVAVLWQNKRGRRVVNLYDDSLCGDSCQCEASAGIGVV
ncbi:hypothetical protein BC629DRAFT_159773 [Irpex lacteus]|nr:hypothetical protein BC629DRAFT_159773 [Irpex lacteus]